MKKLLLLLPLLALASCSYPSKYEAKTACDEWVEKGGEYIYMRNTQDMLGLASKYLAGMITKEEFFEEPEYVEENIDIRYCQNEEETRQYIGWESGKKSGEKYYSGEMPDRKIIKRFRY